MLRKVIDASRNLLGLGKKDDIHQYTELPKDLSEDHQEISINTEDESVVKFSDLEVLPEEDYGEWVSKIIIETFGLIVVKLAAIKKVDDWDKTKYQTHYDLMVPELETILDQLIKPKRGDNYHALMVDASAKFLKHLPGVLEEAIDKESLKPLVDKIEHEMTNLGQAVLLENFREKNVNLEKENKDLRQLAGQVSNNDREAEQFSRMLAINNPEHKPGAILEIFKVANIRAEIEFLKLPAKKRSVLEKLMNLPNHMAAYHANKLWLGGIFLAMDVGLQLTRVTHELDEHVPQIEETSGVSPKTILTFALALPVVGLTGWALWKSLPKNEGSVSKNGQFGSINQTKPDVVISQQQQQAQRNYMISASP